MIENRLSWLIKRSWVQVFRKVAAPGLVVLLGLGFSLVPLFQGKMFFYWDNAQQHYPQTQFLHQWLRSGTIPQWWPQVASGMPVVAEGQAAYYHPFRLLAALLFSPPAALMVEIGVYFALAGLGTYFFLREFRLHKFACVMGGLCQMFGSPSVVLVGNMAVHRGLCAFPFLMCIAERFARTEEIAKALPGILIVALMFLSGHPAMGIVAIIASSTHIFVRLLQRCWQRQAPLPFVVRTLSKAALVWGVVLFLGIGAASIQVIPTLLHTRQSIRDGGLQLDYAGTALVAQVRKLPQALFPYAYQQGDWTESGMNLVPYEGFYIGTLPVILAFLALWYWRGMRDPAGVLSVSTFVAIGFALGSKTPLFPALWSLPGMSGLRYPSRFLVWAAFSLACLTAVGLHRVLAHMRINRRTAHAARPWIAMSVLVLVLGAALWILQPEFHGGIAISLALFAIAIALVAALPRLKRNRRRVVLALMALFVLGDLGLFRARSGYAPSVSIDETLRPPSAARLLQSDPDQFRVMALVIGEQPYRNEELRAFVRPELSTIWGLETADYWFSLVPKRYYALREAIVWELLNSPESAPRLAGFLGALNIKYVISPRTVTLPGWEKVHETDLATTWRNPEILPRAFLVREVLPEKIELRPDWVAKSGTRLERYREMVRDWSTREADAVIIDNILARPIEYRKTAIASAPCGGVGPLSYASPGAEVKTANVEPDEMTFKANASAPALLVVSANFYPGWTATVNGLPAEIYRTNWVGMGVCVPPGQSDVVLQFKTPGLRTGLAVSSIFLIFSLALVIVTRRVSF